MPHCELSLYEQLWNTNDKAGTLTNVIVLGNDLDTYTIAYVLLPLLVHFPLFLLFLLVWLFSDLYLTSGPLDLWTPVPHPTSKTDAAFQAEAPTIARFLPQLHSIPIPDAPKPYTEGLQRQAIWLLPHPAVPEREKPGERADQAPETASGQTRREQQERVEQAFEAGPDQAREEGQPDPLAEVTQRSLSLT